MNKEFDLVNWVKKCQLQKEVDSPLDNKDDDLWGTFWDHHHNGFPRTELDSYTPNVHSNSVNLEAFGQQVPMGTYPSIQPNASKVKDSSRPVPRPIVVVVKINGHPARALIDSGSLGDFISSNLAQQLNVAKIELANPVRAQMAVQGSSTKVNYGVKVNFEYQSINEERYLDIINLSNYDLILGTPFLYQHRVGMCIDPPAIVIGNNESLPQGGQRDYPVLTGHVYL